MWKKGSILVASVMMAALVLGGCGQTKETAQTTTQATTQETTTAPTTQATTSAPAADGTQKVDFHSIQFNIPSDWKFVEGSDSIYYYYPEGRADEFFAFQLQTQVKGDKIAGSKDLIIKGMEGTGTEMKVTNSDDLKVDGMDGFKLECTWKPTGSDLYKSNGVIFINETGVYSVLYSTVEINGGKYDKQAQAVIDSIVKK